MGPMEINGKKYAGNVPMTPFGGMLNDQEMAAVLTYVRNHFGNKAAVVKPSDVARVRQASKDRKELYQVEEILKEHPLKD
jgi:mono/diheme cytochrome c family protein